jgi:hypothetical protein
MQTWAGDQDAGGQQQIAALQQEIRRAGAGASLVSFATFLVGSAALLVALALAGVISGYTSLALRVSLVALCAGGLSAGAAAIAFRQLRAREIRNRLARLPLGEWMVAVSPLLQDENAHTRRMAALLLKDLRRSGEVAPAPSPTPRGNESSPTEGTP